MTGTEELHLSQRALTEENINDILEELNEFLEGASFDKDEKGLEYCSDERLKQATRSLLAALGSQTQNKINSKRMQCNVLRLRPGTTTLTSRSADLIPVKVLGSNPTIDEMELALGSVTHITKEVKVQIADGSALYLMNLMEKKKPT